MTRTRKPRSPEPSAPEPDELDAILNPPDATTRVTSALQTWPSEVPQLIAEDLAWCGSSEDGRHDLLAWLELTFNPLYPLADSPNYAIAYASLLGVLSDRSVDPPATVWEFLEAARVVRRPSLAWQAACWNEAVHRLGYPLPAVARRNLKLEGEAP